MVQYRDIIRRQENKFEKKQDKKGYIKAVITDALGNTSGAGDIWYDRNTRRVWIQENGSASLSQVPCYKITPAIGLGVIVGYEPYSTVREVLATDREFYGPTNSTGTSYESPSNDDFLPGGRLQLWLDPRLLQPLATYPDDTGLVINIVAGDYPYFGTRKTFPGQVSYNISAYQPAGPNEHCLVGLYLDSANSLQVVAGTTVSTAVTAPEPTWPAGAFRLSVVLLDDTQTNIDFVNDVFDRRMAWSDQQVAPLDAQYLVLAANSILTQERIFTPSLPLSGVDGGAGGNYTLSVGAASEIASGVAEIATQAETNTGTDDARIVTPLKLTNWTGAKAGWPAAGKAMINNTEYDTVQLAIDAMAAGDIIKVGQGTDTGGIIPDTAGSIVGLSPVETIITASANDSITVDNSAGTDNLTLENLTVSNTGAGTSVACIQSNKDGLRLDNLDIKKISGAPTNSTGVSVYGGSGDGTYIRNCKIKITAGTNKYGVYASTAACNIVIEGGEINAATADIYIGHASSVVELRGPKLLGGGINNAAGGTVKGWYTNANGDKIIIGASDVKGVGSNTPDLGSTTAAEKWGNIYLALAKDIYPDNDIAGLWDRLVNFGITPDEHWHQNADELAWTGWAAYVGYVTPGTITRTNSQLRVRHSAAAEAFYYRAAATGADIVLRTGASLWHTAAGTGRAGVMVDDGSDKGDGSGPNNYYRVTVEATSITGNWNIRREYRVGGGAAAAAVTAFSLQPGDFYGPVIFCHAAVAGNWGNWWGGMYYRRSNAAESLVQFDNPPFTWTPARVGLYYYISGASVAYGLWDWYDEATG